MNNKQINLCWDKEEVAGRIEVTYGTLSELSIQNGKGNTNGDQFAITGKEPRLGLFLTDAKLDPGACATLVTVWGPEGLSFSFFARDALHPTCPIFIPEYGVAVTTEADPRSYKEIAAAIADSGLTSEFARHDTEPEESFESAALKNRNVTVPTWLGVARDMRYFRVSPVGDDASPVDSTSGYWGSIVTAHHSQKQREYEFDIGRGSSCRHNITRSIENGVLPIVRSIQREEEMAYHVTLFATSEHTPLAPGRTSGTDYRDCYANAGGNMLAKDEKTQIQADYKPDEEIVLCCRVEAINEGSTPCYAWLKAPSFSEEACEWHEGLKLIPADNTAVTALRLNGQPISQNEIAVLVQPDDKATFEFFVPHAPLPRRRAEQLLTWDFDATLEAVRNGWQSKLTSAAQIQIPEQPIQDKVNAGLLHCDIVAVGTEPDGPVAATIGWYAPIGTESAPIIQYFDSVGWHDLAERCLDFFAARQLDNGFIQNFAGYQSETGPWIWTVGEHWRYTHDDTWLKRMTPAIRKACDYLLAWRERNKTEACRDLGCYGLVEGKVADPEDYFHQFYLNGGTYQGLKRATEMLKHTDATYAETLGREVEAYREDIRKAFYHAMAKAPVIPTQDGTWAPFPPSWVEGHGASHFYAEGGDSFTHWAFASRASLIGAMWLPVCEVLDPDELGSNFLLKTNQSPTTCDNAGLTQPYYCRHDWLHLMRGEISSFLRTYYNQLTALADRETHTFWEHYAGASQHKTHEEGWFLMQTRWMLYMERGDTLHVFPGIPRAWLSPGQEVSASGVASYFGKLDLRATMQDDGKCIRASISCHSTRPPASITIRLPHPEGRKALRLEGPGVYCPETESVRIDDFNNTIEIVLGY